MNKSTSLALLAAVLIPVSAQAQVATFNFDGAEGTTNFTTPVPVNGITAMIRNPVGNTSDGNFVEFHQGLVLSAPGYSFGEFPNSFEFSFNVPVTVISYSLSYTSNTSGATITFSNGSSGDATGSLDFSSPHNDEYLTSVYTLNAGQFGTITTNFPDSNGLVELAITVVSPIPEPGSWTILGGAIAGVFAAFHRWRRRVVA